MITKLTNSNRTSDGPHLFDHHELDALPLLLLFFFNGPATTEIYTLSLHDALPISLRILCGPVVRVDDDPARRIEERSEEHTSELQSRRDLVCRLLLEKKKENVGARQLLEQRTGLRFHRMRRFPLVHALGATLINDAFRVSEFDVFGGGAHRYQHSFPTDRSSD